MDEYSQICGRNLRKRFESGEHAWISRNDAVTFAIHKLKIASFLTGALDGNRRVQPGSRQSAYLGQQLFVAFIEVVRNFPVLQIDDSESIIPDNQGRTQNGAEMKPLHALLVSKN